MHMIAMALTFLLAVLAAAQILLLAYLLLLTIAAVTGPPRDSRTRLRRRRFAVLVPAHNEAAAIGRLIASLNSLDYPRENTDVCVVADNCEDATAPIARELGARVYERQDDSERAKGYALRWLLEQLHDEGRAYDAFVVVDADSIVAPNFLTSVDARLQGGAQAIQAHYSVLNADQSSVAALRYAALAAVHYLRPLGRARFGLSAGLKGNGMCFEAALLYRFAWNWFTLAEDVEFHLALVGKDIRVEFAHETWVKADMPITFAQAQSQNARWERGLATSA